MNSGYDWHIFLKKDEVQPYRCLRCMRVLKNPMQITVCGHQFCKLCLRDDLTKCPVCDKTFKKTEVFPDESVRQKILKFSVRCPANKCKWKGTFKDFQEKHKHECPFRLVVCPHEGCGQNVAQDSLAEHQDRDCVYRLAECPHCGENITIKAQKAHEENECKRINVDCPNQCAQKIPKEEIAAHIAKDCEKTKVDCPFKNVGCVIQIERGELAKHQRDAMADHLRLVMLVLDKTRREKDEMAVKMNALQNKNGDHENKMGELTETQEEQFRILNESIHEIESMGTNRLDTVQGATEQNFETLATVVQQNEEMHEVLMLLQDNLHELGLSSTTGIRSLTAAQNEGRRLTVGVCQHFTRIIGEMKEAMEDQVNDLWSKRNQDSAKALEFEESANKRLEKLTKDIGDSQKELSRLKARCLVDQEAQEESMRNLAMQTQRDYDDIVVKISRERERSHEALEELRGDMAQLELSPITCGSLLWKITDVNKMLRSSITDPTQSLTGNSFFSTPQGYLMRPKIFMNGARANDREHVSIFLQLLPGPYNAALPWPFSQHVRFTLIDQQQNTRHIQKELQMPPRTEAEELRRPTEDSPNNGYGIYKFIEHQALPGDYIVDDTMFVRVEVLETDAQHLRHSDTI